MHLNTLSRSFDLLICLLSFIFKFYCWNNSSIEVHTATGTIVTALKINVLNNNYSGMLRSITWSENLIMCHKNMQNRILCIFSAISGSKTFTDKFWQGSRMYIHILWFGIPYILLTVLKSLLLRLHLNNRSHWISHHKCPASCYRLR